MQYHQTKTIANIADCAYHLNCIAITDWADMVDEPMQTMSKCDTLLHLQCQGCKPWELKVNGCIMRWTMQIGGGGTHSMMWSVPYHFSVKLKDNSAIEIIRLRLKSP